MQSNTQANCTTRGSYFIRIGAPAAASRRPPPLRSNLPSTPSDGPAADCSEATAAGYGRGQLPTRVQLGRASVYPRSSPPGVEVTTIGSELDPAIKTCGKAAKLVNDAHNGGGREAGRTLPAPGVSATRAGEESQKGRRTAFRCGSRGGEHAYSSGKAHMEENVASPACAATLKGPRGGTEECQNARANLWTCGGREVSCELRRCTRRPRQAPQVRIESCAAQRRADGTDGRGRRRPKL